MGFQNLNQPDVVLIESTSYVIATSFHVIIPVNVPLFRSPSYIAHSASGPVYQGHQLCPPSQTISRVTNNLLTSVLSLFNFCPSTSALLPTANGFPPVTRGYSRINSAPSLPCHYPHIKNPKNARYFSPRLFL